MQNSSESLVEPADNGSGKRTSVPDSPGDRPPSLGPQPVTVTCTVTVVLLAVAADLCLYEAPGGTGRGVLLMATAVGLLSQKREATRNADFGLLAVVVLTAAMSMWNHHWSLSLAGWGSLVGFAIKLYQPEWTITEVLSVVPQSVLAAPRELVGHIRRHRPHASPAPEPSGNASRKVIVAPIAACVLFAAIFIAANPVLEHYASELGDQVLHWFKRLLDIISFSRLLSWLGWLLVFAALLRPVVHSWLAGYLRGIPESLERVPGGVADGEDFPAAVATLAALNILFLAYNAMDSVYLYFKAGLPAGISYSDYSHRGCFWLAVALALSTLVIGFIFRGDLNWHPKRRRVSGLSYVWAAQNGLLAVGALRRLQIYIDYNGLTRMRIIGIYGVLLVVVGLALMVWKVRRTRSFVWLVRRDLLALWIAVIVLALTPRDLICCTFNVARVMAGNPRPLTLLHGQPISPAGLPALIPLLDYAGDGQTESDALAPLVRDGVAGLLGRELVQLRKARDGRWSQYQGAGAWALAELEDVSDQLDTTARDGRGKAEEAMRAHTRRWW